MGHRIHQLALATIAMLAALAAAGPEPQDALASHTTRTYTLISPVSPTRYVTSPPRYHDGCSPYTEDYADSPNFDNTSVCFPAVGGNWAMDIGVEAGWNVYIDVNPEAIDGFSAGGTYRVVAGDSDSFNGWGNEIYQYFGIHVYNSSTASWENYAWVVLGHINIIYNSGTVLCGPTTSRCTVAVGTVDTAGTWPAHVHMEVRNYTDGASWVSRAYEWDGPSNANDLLPAGPACSRSAPSNLSYCNTEVTFSDRLGYAGGSRTTFAELNNPYYQDF